MKDLEKKVERVLRDIKDILAAPMKYELNDDRQPYCADFSTPQTRLWSILTALRGPDTDDFYLKAATTAVIRYKLGIAEINAGGATVLPDNWESLLIRRRQPPCHFIAHARRAFEALGLKWDEVN